MICLLWVTFLASSLAFVVRPDQAGAGAFATMHPRVPMGNDVDHHIESGAIEDFQYLE